MTLRRLCNLAYAVLIQGIPPEQRSDFDSRLRGETPLSGVTVLPPEGHLISPAAEPVQTREEIAAQNRQAMDALMGMMPGAVRPA